MRPLVVGRCDRCWDVVPLVLGEHLAIRSWCLLRAADSVLRLEGARAVLFVGDDWAEDHHDVEIVADDGRRLVTETSS